MAAIETGLRQAEALNSKMNDLRERLEKYINLKNFYNKLLLVLVN